MKGKQSVADKIPINVIQEISQSNSQEMVQDLSLSFGEDFTKAKYCLEKIEDPLWKIVCQDIIGMMGPGSLLEIWECLLGDPYSQNKNIDIYCPTEKVNQFVKLYSFVILGSLKTYFPGLKQINIKTIIPVLK